MQHSTSPARCAPWCAPIFMLLLTLFGSTNALAQTTCSSAQGCATLMLSGMVSGLGKNVEGEVWGWAFGGGQAAGTSAIVDELGVIEDTLKKISNELAEIEKDLEALSCGIDVDFVNQYAGGIQSYYQTYQMWVTNMQMGVLPTVKELSEWANCAVGFPAADQTCDISGGVSVQTMMQELANAAAATAGSGGSIADCVKAASGALPKSNTLDDRPWYAANVEPITSWYLGVNVQGLAVLVEAWHFRAWNAITPHPVVDSADEIYAAICPAGNQGEGCIDPISYYNQIFFSNMKAQLEGGGAPYSTDEYLILNGSNNYLLARSIEAYDQAVDPDNAAGCTSTPGALTSKSPCGPTVGYYDDVFPSVAFGPYGYGGTDSDNKPYGTWTSSPARNLQGLLNLGFNTYPFSDVTASRFLCTLSSSGGDTTDCLQQGGGAGLQVGSKIVQFSDLETGSFASDVIGHPLIRFIDGGLNNNTSTQPFMNNAYEELMLTYGENCQYGTNPEINEPYAGLIYYRNDGTGDSDDPDYYIFSLCYAPNYPDEQGWIVAPNFDPRNPVKQYRWPALDWTTLTCSDGSSAADAFNSAGMPTLCGADFDTWYETIVPVGPSTTTISANADTTLSSAAPNSNDGAGWYLSLSANTPRGRGNFKRVLLGFDPDALQKALAAGEVQAVFLTLTPEAPLMSSESDFSQAWQATGTDAIQVMAHPFLGDFIEGDGDLAGDVYPIGTGATWNCAEDADLTNTTRDCLQRWPSPLVNRRAGVDARQEWNRDSAVTWDVTNHVAGGAAQWILRIDNGIPFSDIEGEPTPLYFSREAAEGLGNPDLAPKLVVLYND